MYYIYENSENSNWEYIHVSKWKPSLGAIMGYVDTEEGARRAIERYYGDDN